MAVPLGDGAKTNGERAPALGAYYDRLARWTGWAHRFGYGGGRESLTVHRTLADPRAGGRPTATRLHDLLLDALPSLPTRAVLDAGCGLGGTMLDLAARSSATFLGLTLSETQAAIAREAAAKAGMGSRIAIRVASYDSPPDGPFELAIAIESLAHSPNPAASIAAIAARLESGGCFAIADDVPKAAAAATRDLELFKSGWGLPALLDAAGLEAAFHGSGLAIVTDRDLTAELRPRFLATIGLLEALNRALRRIAPSAALRALLDSYRGGLALERLYRRSLMSYRLIVARKGRQAS